MSELTMTHNTILSILLIGISLFFGVGFGRAIAKNILKNKKKKKVQEILKTLPNGVSISSEMFEELFDGKVSCFSVSFDEPEMMFYSDDIVLLDGEQGAYGEYSEDGDTVTIHYQPGFVKIPPDIEMVFDEGHNTSEEIAIGKNSDFYMRTANYIAFRKWYNKAEMCDGMCDVCKNNNSLQ